MIARITANMRANFKFYRRNRLLVVVSALVVLVVGLSLLPTMFFMTKARHLETIKVILSQLSWYVTFITAAIGLLLVSHHIRNRSLKMVFTKPCPPEIWLLSGFLSASLVAFVFYAVILAVSSALFLVWDIPYQGGVFYIVANEFLQAVVLLSYVSFLAVVMHPAVVVIFLLIFNEATFYSLKPIIAAGISSTSGWKASLLVAMKKLVDFLYLIVPSQEPYAEMKATVYESLRLSDANWKYLFFTFSYALATVILFYLLSVFFMKRKRHI